MTASTARLVAAVGAAAAVALLSSCSGAPTPDQASTSTSQLPLVTGQPAGNNAADMDFAQNMIPHHKQAIELSGLVPDRSTNPKLRALASKISADQAVEVAALQAFVAQWGGEPPTTPAHANMPMNGMVDQATMDKLNTLSGTEFDKLWTTSMIGHHEGAVKMAQAEVTAGANVDAVAMAKKMVTDQQAEITEMKSWSDG